MRVKEAAFRDAGLSKDSAESDLLAAMVAHPVLIERPVVIRGGRAVIGRPPEAVDALL
jgi:arsenate reductase